MRGLRVRVGVHRTSFTFFQEHSIKAKRSTTCERLGVWPAMDVKAARKAALVIAGRNAAGRIMPGKRSAGKVADADRGIAFLKARSQRKGKSATWAKNVESTVRNHILPAFGNWSLAELSATPAAVVQWHDKITEKNGAVAANHAARILRAAYKRAAKLDQHRRHTIHAPLLNSIARSDRRMPCGSLTSRDGLRRGSGSSCRRARLFK